MDEDTYDEGFKVLLRNMGFLLRADAVEKILSGSVLDLNEAELEDFLEYSAERFEVLSELL